MLKSKEFQHKVFELWGKTHLLGPKVHYLDPVEHQISNIINLYLLWISNFIQKFTGIILKLFELWHCAPISGSKMGYFGPVRRNKFFGK